jgi:hypothetical protein
MRVPTGWDYRLRCDRRWRACAPWLLAPTGVLWGWFASSHQGSGRALALPASDPVIGWVCIGAGLVIWRYARRTAAGGWW